MKITTNLTHINTHTHTKIRELYGSLNVAYLQMVE